MSDYLVGHIRTYVPLVIAGLVVWLSDSFGIEVDESSVAALATGLTGAIAAVYYGIVRGLAEKWPWFGNLLGVNKAPAYNE